MVQTGATDSARKQNQKCFDIPDLQVEDCPDQTSLDGLLRVWFRPNRDPPAIRLPRGAAALHLERAEPGVAADVENGCGSGFDLAEGMDFGGIVVDADDGMANLGEAYGCHQAYVAAADHGNNCRTP